MSRIRINARRNGVPSLHKMLQYMVILSAFVRSYGTLCEAPDADFLVRLEEIGRDEYGWLSAA